MSSISAKTRKILWSASGNSCAICKKELTKEIDEKHIILGQECHIRSPKPSGPRYDHSYSKEKLNLPENLLLLCRDHHKEIDDLISKYTVAILEKIKLEHELLVKNRTFNLPPELKVVQTSNQLEVIQIKNGLDLINIFSNMHSYTYYFDETEDEVEYEKIKNFLDCLDDLDILSDVSISMKMDYGKEIKKMIEELKKSNYYIFCAISNDKLTGDGNISTWHVVYVVLTKNSNISIINR